MPLRVRVARPARAGGLICVTTEKAVSTRPRGTRLRGKRRSSTTKLALDTELERIFDICHGCRRCVSLCGAFPTLFDLVDNGPTGEVDGVPKEKYKDVVDQCYLCDMCYMSKCPYVPPHPWNVDFPHTDAACESGSLQEAQSPATRQISDIDRQRGASSPAFQSLRRPSTP